MLTLENLKEFANKFQTSEKNMVREYAQHLFLAALYRQSGSENLLFKGGTALRIIFQSPRFSEDLDFTGQNIHRQSKIDEMFMAALLEMEREGLKIYFKEAKPTSGGYLGLIHYELFDQNENMKFEVSLRNAAKVRGELINIVSDFTPAYALIHLPTEKLAAEKMAALLARRKPRDYYDLYFMLRHPGLNKYVAKNKLKTVLKNLKAEHIDFKRELSVLLPASQQLIVKNFRTILEKEINKYL